MSGSCTAQDIAGSWRGLDGPLREVDQKGFVGPGDGCSFWSVIFLENKHLQASY